MKHRVLLVDDESIALRGLEKLIDWQELNCEIAGTAYSALEAFEIIDDTKPDIIITDLVMPEIDGIEFISQLKKSHPWIEVIILSGYGEFEYAQEAIKNNVCEFLVKPATEEQLKEALNKVSKKIDDRLKRQEMMKKQKELLEKSMPLLKNQYIVDILTNPQLGSDEIENKLKIIDFELDQSSAVCLMVAKNESNDLIMNLSLKDFSESYLESVCSSCTVLFDDYIVILLTGGADEVDDDFVYNNMQMLWQEIEGRFGIAVTIGIGSCFKKAKDAASSFGVALNAVMSRFFLGRGQIIHHSIAIENRDSGQYPYRKADEIIDKIKYQNDCDAKSLAEEIMKSFVKQSGYHIEMIYDYCYYFCMRLVEVLQSQKGEGNETGYETYFADIFERIRKNASITELEGTLSEVIRHEIQVIDGERKKKANSIIEKVKNYIKDNLSEDLTLNAVSSIIYMNPVYFSTLFKQSTGINYHDYVFEEKMKIAQKLLIEDQKKIYEVSEMVGYVNARSFSEAFKRYWGDTPSNYVKEFFDNRGI